MTEGQKNMLCMKVLIQASSSPLLHSSCSGIR